MLSCQSTISLSGQSLRASRTLSHSYQHSRLSSEHCLSVRGTSVYVLVFKCVCKHVFQVGGWMNEQYLLENDRNMSIVYLENQSFSVRHCLKKLSVCLWLLVSVSGCLSAGISLPPELCSVASVSSLASLVNSVCQLSSLSVPLCSIYLSNLGRIHTERLLLHL